MCNVLSCNYTIYWSSFSILNIAVVRHIRLSKIKTLTLRQVLGTNINHRAKFHQKCSNICWDIVIKRFLKQRQSSILDFLEIKFLKGYFAPPFQISQKSLKPLQRYRDFCDFQDGVRNIKATTKRR